jgi:hypothetical protein
MPDIPPAVKTRLQAWWGGLEGGNQAIFEAIYMEAPAAVSRAISGGEWVADAPEPGLAAQLGSDHFGAAAADQIPLVAAPEPVQVTPFHATPGQKVRIDWTERNASQVQIDNYVTDIYVQDPEGQTVGSARLTNAALAARAEAPRTFEFQGAQAVGEYTVVIYINAEGTDQDGVPGAQGYRTTASAQFAVGASESQAATQDTLAWGTGTQTILGAQTAISVLEQLQRVQEGVNWLAATDQLAEQEKTVLAELGAQLAGSIPRFEMQEDLTKPDSLSIEGLAPYRAALERLIGASQSPNGWSIEGRKPVIDALTNLVANLPR